MYVFNSQLHLLTFIFILIEFGMCCYQLVYYLSYPSDRRRLWYLVLLVLLIFYNMAAGLTPDPRWALPLTYQRMLGYGSGFLLAAYFPFYFYRAFGLRQLRLHAILWAPLCLGLPFLLFFGICYTQTGELRHATGYGMLMPFCYAIWLLYSMCRAILRRRSEQQEDLSLPVAKSDYSVMEMTAAWAAILPWTMMPLSIYLQVDQWMEALLTNSGFVVITILFIARNIRENREMEQRRSMERFGKASRFSESCAAFGLSKRETEVAGLLCKGLTYKQVADQLFISEHTVDNHIQHIFAKTGVRRRIELYDKLGWMPI